MLAAPVAQLAEALLHQGKLTEAEGLWREVLSRRGQPGWSGNAWFSVQFLLATFRSQGRHAEAVALLEDEFEHGGPTELNGIAWFLANSWAAEPRDASNAVRF